MTIMSFGRKRNVDICRYAHVDLTLKLYLMSHAFQIPNFRFSLEWVAREDNTTIQNGIRARICRFEIDVESVSFFPRDASIGNRFNQN